MVANFIYLYCYTWNDFNCVQKKWSQAYLKRSTKVCVQLMYSLDISINRSWHEITNNGWYAFKPNQTNPIGINISYQLDTFEFQIYLGFLTLIVSYFLDLFYSGKSLERIKLIRNELKNTDNSLRDTNHYSSASALYVSCLSKNQFGRCRENDKQRIPISAVNK